MSSGAVPWYDARTPRQRKRADQRFYQLLDRGDLHIRVPDRTSGVQVSLVGHARDLHGPTGVCTCCPRRPAP